VEGHERHHEPLVGGAARTHRRGPSIQRRW
jgi:hypothetical protein